MTRKVAKEVIESAVSGYIELFGVTNTRRIAEYVFEKIGVRPSTATVARILREFGYVPVDGVSRWVRSDE